MKFAVALALWRKKELLITWEWRKKASMCWM